MSSPLSRSTSTSQPHRGTAIDAYDAQQESTARLEAALTAKTQFIADASHELRTPLTVLRGNAEVGLATLGGGGHHDILREIVADAARMTRLVEDLLFLARSDPGSVALEFSLVSLEPWAAEVAARGEVLSREHGVRFAARLSAMGEARIDPGRVDQAVLGVVDNAAKVSGPRGYGRSVSDGPGRLPGGRGRR